MEPSGIGCASVTAEPAVSEVVHLALSSSGWTVCPGRGTPEDQLEIIDVAAFRACSGPEQDERFPRANHRRGSRACVLVCRPDEYPDAPHDRFDAVVTAPVTAPRLLALVAALFPPRGGANPEP